MYRLLFILFLILPLKSYSQIDVESLETTYIQIKAKKIKDDFFEVKYNFSNDEFFIGLNNLFYLLEIFTLDIKADKREVNGELDGKKINIKFPLEKSFEENGELYVSPEVLKEYLNFSQVNYNSAILSLELQPNFTLAYEQREKGKLERMRLDRKTNIENKNYNYEMKGKILRPGLLKLDYSLPDIDNQNYYLDYEYGTELFYGQYYMNGSIKPKEKVDDVKLIYSNFWKNNTITLGTYSLQTPSFINFSSTLVGININADSIYSKKENGVTIIKGEAINADSVEVYRNNILLDYVNVNNNRFQFEINDGVLNANYLLKIYFNDGKIEERWVYSLGDEASLEKGKSKFILQTGKNKDSGDFQNIIGGYYGLSNNLTIGSEIYNLKLDSGEKLDFLKNTLLLKTNLLEYPILLNYKNYYFMEYDEFSYSISLMQKINNFNFKIEREEYSKSIVKKTNTKYYTSFSVSTSRWNTSFDIGLLKKRIIQNSEKENDIKTIYGAMYSSIFSPISLNLKIEKNLTKNNEGIIYNPSLSYARNFNIILDGKIEKYRDETNQTYTLKIGKRQLPLIKDKLYGDLNLQIEYDNKYREFKYGLSFNIDIDSFMKVSLRNNFNFDKNKKIQRMSGVSLGKIINLSNPLERVDNNAGVNDYIIQGYIFLDKNGNGIYDTGDEAIEGAVLEVENYKVKSKKDGFYLLTGISEKDIVTLKVNRKTIDIMQKNTNGDTAIKVKNSRSINIDIPVETVSMITGNIWNTEDFIEKKFTQNIANTVIILEKNGELYKEIDPEFDGMFFLDDVSPGKYKLKFSYLGTDRVAFEPNELDVDIVVDNPYEGLYIDSLDTKMVLKDVNIEEDMSEQNKDIIDEFDELINFD